MLGFKFFNERKSFCLFLYLPEKFVEEICIQFLRGQFKIWGQENGLNTKENSELFYPKSDILALHVPQ